jgi:antitoxin component YwqK of YwqJK toxin-antitoxin module
MKLYLLILSLLVTIPSFSQSKQYIDVDFNITNDVNKAKYFRIVQFKDSLYESKIYYMTGDIMMAGTYLDKDLEVENGYFEYYFANGNMESTGLYTNGVKVGYWKRWVFDGTKKEDRYYR